MLIDKVILVEGLSDNLRVSLVLAEPVIIVCTNGTVSAIKLDELLAPYVELDIFVFVDSDPSGDKLRSLCKREFPEARHLHTESMYREVATTPLKVLASILLSANIEVKTEFIA